MKPYNGFSPEQREASMHWMNAAILRREVRAYPGECSQCGQREGQLSYHTEDYSWPFGPHVVEHHLCAVCHLLLHARFTRPARWTAYLALLRDGCRAAPVRDFRAAWTATTTWTRGGAFATEDADGVRLAPFLHGLSATPVVHPNAGNVMPDGAGAELRRIAERLRRRPPAEAPSLFGRSLS